MARTARTFLWVMAAFIILGACAPGAFAKDLIRWKMATLAPKGLGYANLMETLIMPWLKEQTDDSVRLKVYFGGVLGNDKEYLEKMAIGQLNGAGLDAMGVNLACPEMTVLGLPFLFNNYDEVDHIREVMYPTFDYYFAQYGYKFWMWLDQDFDQIYSAKWRFDKIEDFSKSKFQAWYGPLETTMLEDLGAKPIPIQPTEANMAYRTGIIDSNIGPAIFQVGTQMYTSCKYINTMKTRYCPAAVVVNMRDWETLDPDTMEKLSDTDDLVKRFCIGVRKDNNRCIEGMVKYGLELVEMTPENRDYIKKKATAVYGQLADKLYPKDLLLEVQRYLAAHRAGRPVSAAAVPTKRKAMGKELAAAAKAADDAKKAEAVAAAAAKKAEAEAAEKARLAKQAAEEDARKAELAAAEEARKAAEKARAEELAAAERARKAEAAAAAAAAAEEAKAAEEKRKADEEAAAMMAKLQKQYEEDLAAKKKAEAEAKAAGEVKKVQEPSAEEMKKKREASWKERARQVRAAQEVLASMGLYPARMIDGIYGPYTRKGIQEYQKQKGLKVTGSITQELLDAMGIK